MKITVEILIITILFFQSCKKISNEKSNKNIQLDNTTKEIEPDLDAESISTERIITDLKPDSISIKKVKPNYKKACKCNWPFQKLSHHTDLTFSNNGTPFKLDSLTKYKNKKALNIKSLRLIDFDTIPIEMSMFKNVENIYLEAINNKNVQGLEIFPKLKIIKADQERFVINKKTKWIKNIEVIYATKTKFSGLKSFNQMPKLRELRLSFSGFDSFPSDFESLKCLSYFQTGAHTFCKVDLTQLDLTKLPCLKHVTFQSWLKNLKGIPNGVSNIKYFNISHPNLTKSEKEKLKNNR